MYFLTCLLNSNGKWQYYQTLTFPQLVLRAFFKWVKCWMTPPDTQQSVSIGRRGWMLFGVMWKCANRRVCHVPIALRPPSPFQLWPCTWLFLAPKRWIQCIIWYTRTSACRVSWMATAVENPVRGTKGSRQVEVRWDKAMDRGTLKPVSPTDHFKSKQTNRKNGSPGRDGWSWLSLWEEPRKKQANLQDNGVRLILPCRRSSKTTHRVNISWCAMRATLTSTACSRWHCRCDSHTAWWGSGSPAKRRQSAVNIHCQGNRTIVLMKWLQLECKAAAWELLLFKAQPQLECDELKGQAIHF